MIDSMAYFDSNYLLSNSFKAPVCGVGSALLLGQLPLARSYQVQKGFSRSPFCTRKYFPCLVIPSCQQVLRQDLPQTSLSGTVSGTEDATQLSIMSGRKAEM